MQHDQNVTHPKLYASQSTYHQQAMPNTSTTHPLNPPEAFHHPTSALHQFPRISVSPEQSSADQQHNVIQGREPDGNETFEPNSQMDDEHFERLRLEQLRWRHLQTWQREHQHPTTAEQFDTLPPRSRGPLSDTEIYGRIGHRTPQYQSYRAPRNMSVEQMEARCAALRQEFINFRRQTMPLYEPSSSTSSSNEFESIC